LTSISKTQSKLNFS